MDFQQIRDFVNPAVAQATGMQEVENLSMPVPVAYVPVQLVIDGALSLTSENPVQNKVIAVAIQNLDGRITAVEGQFAEGVTEAVNNWLAAHPEATTTVQDGAISYAKLDTNLKGKVDEISELKSAMQSDEDNYGTYATGIKNLFNSFVNRTENYYLNDEGVATSYSGFWYSDLIPVEPGDYRFVAEDIGTSGNVVRVHGYDANGNWVEMIAKYTNSLSFDVVVTIPNTVKNIRISAYYRKHVLFFGNALTPISETIKSLDQEIDGYSVFYDALSFTKNIFNKDDSTNIHVGYFRSSSTGQLVSNSAFTELLVPCLPNKKYICNGTNYSTSFYNSSMTKIGVGSDGSDGTARYSFTTPAGCAYVSLNIKPARYSVASYMVVTGETYPNVYIPYNVQIINLLNAVRTPGGVSISEAIDSSNMPMVYHVGANREYTSFTACIRALANDSSNKVIYIDAGTYDIYNEIGGDAFADTVGIGVWTEYSDIIPPNTKIVGIGHVVFNFDVTSSNGNAYTRLSPINVKWSVEIENITINANNCRYAIHDDGSSDTTARFTKHIYKNVEINKTGSQGYVQGFGAGIGKGTIMEFVGCVFKARAAFSIHSSTESYDGLISFRDCAFNSTDGSLYSMRFSGMAAYTGDQNIPVNLFNCYMNQKILLRREDAQITAQNNPFKLTVTRCSNVTIDTSGYTSEELRYEPVVYQ